LDTIGQFWKNYFSFWEFSDFVKLIKCAHGMLRCQDLGNHRSLVRKSFRNNNWLTEQIFLNCRQRNSTSRNGVFFFLGPEFVEMSGGPGFVKISGGPGFSEPSAGT